jgi:hypothetical protein
VEGFILEFVLCLRIDWMGADDHCGTNAVWSISGRQFRTFVHDVFRVDLFCRLFCNMPDGFLFHQAIQETTDDVMISSHLHRSYFFSI